MERKMRRLNPRVNLLFMISLYLLTASVSSAQLKVSENLTLDAYKYPDIPFHIFFVNVSNSGSDEMSKIKGILFINYPGHTEVQNSVFYISSSLNKIPSKTINNEGVIAYRGIDNNFILQSSLNDSKITSDLIRRNSYDNYKEEAYALALILALENYKAGDTLVNYYYKNYYLSNNPDMKIPEDNYLKEYLDAAIIRAANIYENQQEDLNIPEIKEITKNLNESRNKGNNDTVFNKGLRNYYIELARYYSKSGEKDYETIAGYYESASDIEIEGEIFGNSDLFNYANALFYIEQDIWAEDESFDFRKCKQFYETLMKNNYKLCEVYLKLGAIYYMENYSTGNFSESKKYFNRVIENNCKEQTEKAKKNLKNINELEKK